MLGSVTPGSDSSSGGLLRTLRSIAAWVGAAIGLSLLGLLAVRRCVPVGALRSSSDAVGNYLQTLGSIYAVLLAFVVFVVWQQFNDARTNIDREANELFDLARTVNGLPTELSRPFLELVDAYVRTVLNDEWPAMAERRRGPLARGNTLLDSMWDLLVAYEPRSECHKSLYDNALSRYNDLSDSRTNRVVSSRLRIPLALRLLLYVGAAVTVGSLWLFAVDSFAIHALMTGALAGSVSHILYVISDLDDCFRGNWQVPRFQFERVGAAVTALLTQGPAVNQATLAALLVERAS